MGIQDVRENTCVASLGIVDPGASDEQLLLGGVSSKAVVVFPVAEELVFEPRSSAPRRAIRGEVLEVLVQAPQAVGHRGFKSQILYRIINETHTLNVSFASSEQIID